MSVPDYVRAARHAADLSDAGHDSYAPNVILESNAGATVDTNFGRATWDTYYDRNFADLTGVLPDGIGFTDNGTGELTITEDCVLSIFVNVFINPTPGHAGSVGIVNPGFGSFAQVAVANPNTIDQVTWAGVFAAAAGQNLRLGAFSGTTGDQLVTYASIDIVRLA